MSSRHLEEDVTFIFRLVFCSSSFGDHNMKNDKSHYLQSINHEQSMIILRNLKTMVSSRHDRDHEMTMIIV